MRWSLAKIPVKSLKINPSIFFLLLPLPPFSFFSFFAFTDSLEIHCTLLNRNDPVAIHPDADRAPDLLMLVSSFTPNSKVSEVVS